MTVEEPLYVFKTSILKSQIVLIRTVLYLGALFLGITALVIKLFMDVEPFIFYLVLGVAALDVFWSIVLPPFLARQEGAVLKVYKTSIALSRGAREIWSVPREYVRAIMPDEDISDKDRAAGLVNVIIVFDPPLQIAGVKLPNVKITGFSAGDDPFGHLQSFLSK